MKSANFLDFHIFGTRFSFVWNRYWTFYYSDLLIGLKILNLGKFRIVWGKDNAFPGPRKEV